MDKTINKILFFAFLIRLVLLLIDNMWFRLPQGGIDTEYFDQLAYAIYLGREYSLSEIFSNGVVFFAYMGYFIYSLVGREPSIWAFCIIFFGVGTVFYVYKTVLVITQNYKYANLSAWFVCLFPNIAILSALVLREAPIHFFLTLGIYHLVKFNEEKGIRNLVIFFFCTLIITILHSAFLVVFAGFVLGILFFNKKINMGARILAVILSLVIIYGVSITGVGLSKFGGSIDSALEKVDEGIAEKESGAVYPEWLIMKDGFNDIWKLPLRMVAFFFAPLIPFLVKNSKHLVGLIDAAFYLYLFYWIFKYRRSMTLNKTIASVLNIIFILTVAFSFGSSNFGTNIRHRAKIYPLVVIVAVSARGCFKDENEDNEFISFNSNFNNKF